MLSIFLLFLLCIFSSWGSTDFPKAETENGPVAGTYETTLSGKIYKAFRGIPYAKPPVDDNRFKEPERFHGKWIGEWNAKAYGSQCLQLNHLSRTYVKDSIHFNVVGSEDCLYLNIFSREGGPAKKSVIFTIHGGGFMWGSGQVYGPDYMMERDDIVYVTFNYRVGPIGFATTGDSVIPGNNGLKDQAAALAWVNRNIAKFGGDPDDVAITGLSAGGASVDFMYLSPHTNGLFKRGYSFSGSAFNPWTIISDGPEKTKQLAAQLGCPTSDSRTIFKCLRTRPAELIVAQVRTFQNWLYNPYTVFGPVVESGSSNPYIDQHPLEIMRQGLGKDLPWMAGLTTEEGLYPAADFVTNEVFMEQLDKNWKTIGPSLLFLNPEISKEEQGERVEKAKQHYLGSSEINMANRDKLVRLLSERLFMQGLVEMAKLRASKNKSPVYLYLYGHQANFSQSDLYHNDNELLGACHGDDIMFLVKFPGIKEDWNAKDKQIAEILRDIFYTFELTGKPPKKYKWPKVSKSTSDAQYLLINSPDDIKVTSKQMGDFDYLSSVLDAPASKRVEL